MRTMYCTCRSKTHKAFHECETDEEDCCIDCGHYATKSVVRVTIKPGIDYTIEENYNRGVFDQTVRRYFSAQKEHVDGSN